VRFSTWRLPSAALQLFDFLFRGTYCITARELPVSVEINAHLFLPIEKVMLGTDSEPAAVPMAKTANRKAQAASEKALSKHLILQVIVWVGFMLLDRAQECYGFGQAYQPGLYQPG
jgi:hypothetical protein